MNTHINQGRRSRIALGLALALILVSGGPAGCRQADGNTAGAARNVEPMVVQEIVTQAAPTQPSPTRAPPTARPQTAAVPAPVVPAGDPGAEALVYSGSIPLKPSEDDQEYSEGIWEGDLQAVPLRAPDGATAAFAYTHDTLEQVQAHYDAALTADGWDPVRQGIGMNAWGYLWKKGEANLIVLLITNFSEEHLTWFADTFDLQLPDADVVLVATYLW